MINNLYHKVKELHDQIKTELVPLYEKTEDEFSKRFLSISLQRARFAMESGEYSKLKESFECLSSFE